MQLYLSPVTDCHCYSVAEAGGKSVGKITDVCVHATCATWWSLTVVSCRCFTTPSALPTSILRSAKCRYMANNDLLRLYGSLGLRRSQIATLAPNCA